MKRVVVAVLVCSSILAGCSAGTEVTKEAVVETVTEAETRELTEEQEFAEKFGLTEAEVEAIKIVISSGPYTYELSDIATIERTGEDDNFVKFWAETTDGDPLKLDISRKMIGE